MSFAQGYIVHDKALNGIDNGVIRQASCCAAAKSLPGR
jgi:hypothetical protein